jgi:phosphate/sulfate permease
MAVRASATQGRRPGDILPGRSSPLRSAPRLSRVWNVASEVVIAWVLTMPAAALIGALFYKLGGLFQ